MRNTLNSVLIFAAGAIIGSAVTWKFIKTKYEKMAQEEIDSVKEVYSRDRSEPEKDTEEEADIPKVSSSEQTTIMEYAKMLDGMGYTNYSSNSKSSIESTKKTHEKKARGPYVINPDEFGEPDDYSTVFLNYYADEVVAYDNDDEIFEDADKILGANFSDHFGDYEPDVVYIRNDEERCDYEICRDLRKYLDIIAESPHEAEDEWNGTT